MIIINRGRSSLILRGVSENLSWLHFLSAKVDLSIFLQP